MVEKVQSKGAWEEMMQPETSSSRKLNLILKKHSASDVLVVERQTKQSRTSLQASPAFAGNIRLVADYGGIDVYVEPDKDMEPTHEECFPYLDEDGAESSYLSEHQQENEGPPQLSDDEVARLDHEASLEELVCLRNMGVSSEYPFPCGNEMWYWIHVWSLIGG